MTVARQADPIGARPPRDYTPEATADADRAATGSVVVLAPAYSGASTLRSLLEDHPDLACTSGTGLLPLCEHAMATWRKADGRLTGTPSSLSSTATRALATSVILSILAREGKRRWCEVASASPEAAEAFLRLYPGTRFLCLYRACSGVVRAALDASPWGITDPVFTPFTIRYPANTVASLTAYWITVTGPLLAFERDHPQSCLRVRYEDLAHRPQAKERITSFLGVAEALGRPFPDSSDETLTSSPNPGLTADIPVNLIPSALLAQANSLLRQLDYPVIGESATLSTSAELPDRQP
jgi:hypothetical protein